MAGGNEWWSKKAISRAACPGRIWILQLLLITAVWLNTAKAETLCADMPVSSLEVFAIKAEKVEEWIVSDKQFRAMKNSEADVAEGKVDRSGSRYSWMISTSDLITSFYVVHRMSGRDDGMICDSPVNVRLYFGPSRRIVVMPREVAANQCMRRLALDHETDRAQAVEQVVGRFVQDQASDYQNLMRKLKETPAPNAELAIRRWDAVLSQMVDIARRRLIEDIRSAVARIDGMTPDGSSQECTNGDLQ